MYQFSRASTGSSPRSSTASRRRAAPFETRTALLRACEASMERLATDRHYFARPARTLFSDIRCYFPVCRQEQVYHVVERYMALADEFVAALPAQRRRRATATRGSAAP